MEGATEEYAERVRPEERTARVKGWRMDCMMAIWLRQHLGAAERSGVRGRGGGGGVYISCEYVKSQRASKAELELPFPFCLADNFPPMIPDPRRTSTRETSRGGLASVVNFLPAAKAGGHIDTRYSIIPRN